MKSNTIVIQGLSDAVTVPAMANLAQENGHLSRLVVQRDSGINPSGAKCWITFQRRRDAVAAMTYFEERYLAHRKIDVSWVAPESVGGLRLQ